MGRPRSNLALRVAAGSQIVRATITVEWGYESHSITLTARNWAHVKAGRPLEIRGKGYHYEGEFFWDYWSFGESGSLDVFYGEDCGHGFSGELSDALVTEHE